jgi:hypothetical protein
MELLRKLPKVLFQMLSETRQAADLVFPEPGIAISVEEIPAGASA